MRTLTRSLFALAFLLGAHIAAAAEEIFLQSVQSGLFVTVVNGTLAAVAPNARSATRLDTVRLEGNRMAFRDVATGNFVRAGVGPGTFLASGSPHIRGWETFEVTSMGGDQHVALRSVQNRKFVRAGIGDRSHLAAVSQQASGWETFRFVVARIPAQADNQSAGQNRGLDTAAMFGNYFITHIAADNGYLVRLGGQIEAAARLSVDDRGTVRATVGCNSMSVSISVREGRIRTESSVLTSKVNCSGQGQTAAERGIGRAFTTSRFVVRQGSTVTFKAADGSELMRISRR